MGSAFEGLSPCDIVATALVAWPYSMLCIKESVREGPRCTVRLSHRLYHTQTDTVHSGPRSHSYITSLTAIYRHGLSVLSNPYISKSYDSAH